MQEKTEYYLPTYSHIDFLFEVNVIRDIYSKVLAKVAELVPKLPRQ